MLTDNRIRFSVHNLLQAIPWQDAFDLAFLRNALIYFKPNKIRTAVCNVALRYARKGC